MLRLVLGTDQGEKTLEILKRISDCLDSGRGEKILLLVPEQFSFECEKELLKRLGAARANRVSVVSFTRLCRLILGETGGIAAKIADDGVRMLMLGQAVEGLKDTLRVYGGASEPNAFAARLLGDINELKQAALTPAMLRQCAAEVASAGLRDKLYDMSDILSAYDSLLVGKFTDPADMLTVTAARAAESKWFADRLVFVDGFTGFTRSQYLLLEEAVRRCSEAVFGFCCDEDKGGSPIFENIRNEISFIRSLAAKHGIAEAEPSLVESSRANDAISAVGTLLKYGRAVPFENKNVFITECDSPEDEAEFVASEMHRLVRTEAARWRDFVLISGKDNDLSLPLAAAARRHGIPMFISKTVPMRELPLACFVSSVLSCAANGKRTEDMLSLLRSGLCGLTSEEVERVESYAYIWSISGAAWEKRWGLSPYGLEERPRKSYEAELEQLNELRARVIEPLSTFEKTVKAGSFTAAELVKALYRLLSDYSVADMLAAHAERLEALGEHESASLQYSSWDRLMSILDRITLCCEGRSIRLSTAFDMLQTAFATETVGSIPQRTDEVIYGTADRIRPMHPKTVFVLGANYGVFPAGISNTGLFSLAEREEMAKSGAPLPDRYKAAVTEQSYFFYTACTQASDKVYITYSKQASGCELKPAVQVKKLLGMTELSKACFSSSECGADSIESAASAFQRVAAAWQSPDTDTATLRLALEMSGYSDRLSRLGRGITRGEVTVSEATASRLYRDGAHISPSQVESFYSCPFMYFCRYGMGLKPKKRARLDSLSRGTAAHYILERVLKSYEGRYSELTAENVSQETEAALADYFAELSVDRGSLDGASRYALEALSKGVEGVLLSIAAELAQSDFAPTGFEAAVAEDGELAPLEIKSESRSVKLIGKIDRVDITLLEDGRSYVRIIDYKTGKKSFKLSNVLYGLNMQMLFYLYAVTENRKKPFGRLSPAGILYTQVFPQLGEEQGELKPSGLLTSDIAVLEKMEKKLAGKYIPLKMNKDGTINKDANVISEEDFATVFEYITKKAADMAEATVKGEASARPIKYKDLDGCKYCDFRAVCGLEEESSDERPPHSDKSNAELTELMRRELEQE